MEITTQEKILKVGLISFGLSQWQNISCSFCNYNPNFKQLVAVYERSKSESKEFCEKFNYQHQVKIVRSIKELCSISEIDLIIVCSPIEFHFEHATYALHAGKHVLVEKAFCSNSQQAQELTRLASDLKLVCVPYQNRRFDADFRTLQRLVLDEQLLGEIVEYNGFYDRWSPTVRNVWKDQVVGSGGNFLSLGSHMIDQAVSLFGVIVIKSIFTFLTFS